jgi:predicted transposase YdaD
MAKKFDATLKTLLEESPGDWLCLAGKSPAPVSVIDADVSTVTAATDKVLRVTGKRPWVMHIDFQAGPDASLPRRVHGYNALLGERHRLPVHSLVILLRPEANLSTITRAYAERLEDHEEPYLTFQYQVVRVWQMDVAQLLAGGLGTLPLAPISAVPKDEVPGVVQRISDRMREARDRAQAERLWTATYVLMGLRFEQAFTDKLLGEVLGMEESVTYQAIVAKGRQQGIEIGRVQEARANLLRLGREQFQLAAPPRIRRQLSKIEDRARLEELLTRVLRASSWEELMEAPED